MSLVISKVFTYDTDAGDYIQRVEGASGDNQALEPATRQAINNFVIGCKQDGIWNAIKASCILSGARTLNGSLQPLVGTAPTNVGGLFVSGDYNRKTGLVGNGTSKYLDSNRNNNADPQNNCHLSAYVTSAASGTKSIIGADFAITGTINLANVDVRCRNTTQFNTRTEPISNSLLGVSRSSAGDFNVRRDRSTQLATSSSQNPASGAITVYRNPNSSNPFYANARLAFYSIGESLDLALLDARVTALITAFGVAIP